MATKELVGRYKEYKTKTKDLLYWLTRTASGCCDLATVVKSLAGKGSPSIAPAATTPALEIRTHELLVLAKTIASADPPVDIPEGIILIIRDVIAGREDCAEWYSAQALKGGSNVAKENDSHRYFIEILRRLLSTLEDARAKSVSTTDPLPKTKTKAKVKEDGAKPDDDAVFTGLFQALELEEPGKNPLGSKQNRDATDSTPQTSAQAKFVLEKANEDNAFKTWCFLKDLSDIREAVKKTWQDYASGDISFFAASVITDTALRLLRRADDEFADNSPFGSTDWSKLLHFLGIDYFVYQGAIWMHPIRSHDLQEPRMPEADINIVELLCPIAFLCLKFWKAEVAQLCEVEQRLKNGGKTQFYKSNLGQIFHMICESFQFNVRILHKFTHCRSSGCGARDEFIRALVDIHESSTTPMWAVVACQIYMDVQDLLGHHAEHGVVLIREEYDLVKKIRQEVLEYNPTDTWAEPNVRSGMERFDMLIRSAWTQIRAESLRSEYTGPPSTMEEAKVCQRRGFEQSSMALEFPAYAGNLLAEFRLTMYAISNFIACHDSCVLTVAHIYRALRAMGLLDHTWQDMEFAISSFAPRDSLVANP